MSEIENLPPKGAALYLYKQGGGIADNPYQQGSDEYWEFLWEMSRLQDEELKRMDEEIRGGV